MTQKVVHKMWVVNDVYYFFTKKIFSLKLSYYEEKTVNIY
jgi:hypothetical protein